MNAPSVLPSSAWASGARAATGAERAAHQVERLAAAGLVASVRPAEHGDAILRLGPLAHEAAWLALEAFTDAGPRVSMM